jgi:hypothetical protein
MNIMAIVIYPLSYNSVQNQKNVFPLQKYAGTSLQTKKARKGTL